MTLHDLATLCGNEHVTKLRANIQDYIFSLLVVCCGTWTVVDIGNYSIEEHSVASIWVHKKTAQVTWWIRWWHYYSNDLGSHLHAEQFFYYGEYKMWKILPKVVSHYPEQWCVLLLRLPLKSLHKSVRKWSAELRETHSTTFDHKRDLAMKSFQPVFLYEFSDADVGWHHEACALSWESSLFRQMYNLPQLPVSKRCEMWWYWQV